MFLNLQHVSVWNFGISSFISKKQSPNIRERNQKGVSGMHFYNEE